MGWNSYPGITAIAGEVGKVTFKHSRAVSDKKTSIKKPGNEIVYSLHEDGIKKYFGTARYLSELFDCEVSRIRTAYNKKNKLFKRFVVKRYTRKKRQHVPPENVIQLNLEKKSYKVFLGDVLVFEGDVNQVSEFVGRSPKTIVSAACKGYRVAKKWTIKR